MWIDRLPRCPARFGLLARPDHGFLHEPSPLWTRRECASPVFILSGPRSHDGEKLLRFGSKSGGLQFVTPRLSLVCGDQLALNDLDELEFDAGSLTVLTRLHSTPTSR